MPNRFIYVQQGGTADPSRWLQISSRPNGDCVLHLQDLCMPGRISQLSAVSCPIGFLRTAIDRGAIQITTGTGYLLLRQNGEFTGIEFRGLDDIAITKVMVKTEEVRSRLEAIQTESALASTH